MFKIQENSFWTFNRWNVSSKTSMENLAEISEP